VEIVKKFVQTFFTFNWKMRTFAYLNRQPFFSCLKCSNREKLTKFDLLKIWKRLLLRQLKRSLFCQTGELLFPGLEMTQILISFCHRSWLECVTLANNLSGAQRSRKLTFTMDVSLNTGYSQITDYNRFRDGRAEVTTLEMPPKNKLCGQFCECSTATNLLVNATLS